MYIKVKVTPNSKIEDLQQTSSDTFVLKIREKAERNMANTRIRELFSIHYKVPIGKVKIISGHHSPSKIVSIESVV